MLQIQRASLSLPSRPKFIARAPLLLSELSSHQLLPSRIPGKVDTLYVNSFDGTMLSGTGTISFFRTLTAEQAPGEPSSAPLQPPRYLASISGRASYFKGGFGAAAKPLLLLLLLSQKPAEDGRHVRELQERTRLDASLESSSGTQGFGLLYATAAVNIQSSSIVKNSPAGKTLLQEHKVEHSPQVHVPSGVSVKKAALHGDFWKSGSGVEKADASVFRATPSHLLVESEPLASISAPKPAPYVARNVAGRRLAQSEDARGRGKDTGEKAHAAGRSRAGSRREDVEARRREQTPEGRDAKAEAISVGRGGDGGKRASKVSEGKRTQTWDMSLIPLRNYSRAAHEEFTSTRSSHFSRLPPPLPEHRVLPALRKFEKVHGQLTLFFNGFSRRGSVIAYDLLNELRTVSEAQMMMDVEFLVLDRVMQHYGATTHMRVVDTTVVHRLLDLSNLLPWKFPQLVSNIRKLALEYQPVLRQFLNRYEPIIEALVLVKVPAGVKPLRPFLAHVFGVPKEKLILASDLNDLRDHIPLKYIPIEFGNVSGGRVRDGAENYMSWIIMLEEIAQKLGEDSLSSSAKAMLKEFKENRRKAKAAAGRKEAAANRTNLSTRGRQSSQAPLSPAPVRGFLSAEDSEGVIEGDRSEEDSEDVGLYEKNDVPLRRGTLQNSAVAGSVDEEDDEKDYLEDISDDFDYVS